MRPFTSSGCTHHRAFMPVFVHHSDPPSMTSGCLYRVGSIHTHTHTHTDTRTHTEIHTDTRMHTHAHTHTRTHARTQTDRQAHTQDTHTNAKGFQLISDHFKRVGSEHWPPYPCKALRLLALMKPLTIFLICLWTGQVIGHQIKMCVLDSSDIRRLYQQNGAKLKGFVKPLI